MKKNNRAKDLILDVTSSPSVRSRTSTFYLLKLSTALKINKWSKYYEIHVHGGMTTSHNKQILRETLYIIFDRRFQNVCSLFKLRISEELIKHEG